MNDSTNNKYTAEYWIQQVQAWKLSGLSQAKFCRHNELVYNQFIYQRAKLEAGVLAPRTQQSENGFARVNVKPAQEEELTLSLPNGFILRGINTQNVSVVRELLDQL